MNKQSKNICIHVCDDNPVAIEEAIKITKDLLNEEGLAAEIITYKDGNQFTERYKERKDELIILDIEMPGKSGLDILKEFETHCKNNRVILLTAYDNLTFFNFGTIFHCYHISCMNSDKPFASQLKFIISQILSNLYATTIFQINV